MTIKASKIHDLPEFIPAATPTPPTRGSGQKPLFRPGLLYQGLSIGWPGETAHNRFYSVGLGPERLVRLSKMIWKTFHRVCALAHCRGLHSDPRPGWLVFRPAKIVARAALPG